MISQRERSTSDFGKADTELKCDDSAEGWITFAMHEINQISRRRPVASLLSPNPDTYLLDLEAAARQVP